MLRCAIHCLSESDITAVDLVLMIMNVSVDDISVVINIKVEVVLQCLWVA